MKKLKRYLDERKLTLNAMKSKIMIFGKGREKNKKTKWIWKGREIEIVKKFVYLGIRLQKNGQWKAHIRDRVKKAIF